VDFECAYQRLKGKNVLFPFGYHCTGMPICAAADRLKREMKLFPETNGKPPAMVAAPAAAELEPVVEEKKEEDAAAAGAAAAGAKGKKGGKSKVAAKSSTQTYQWNILKEMGVPESEIPKFQDAKHWCTYFPPIAPPT